LADTRRVLGAVAVAMLAMALPGCLSPVPLDPRPQADLDPRLVGAWRCLPPAAAADDEPVNITIKAPRERVYAIEMAETGKDVDHYEAHGSTVGGRTIANVRDVSATEKPWDFAEVEFLRSNVLLIRLAGEDAFKGAPMTPAGLRERMGKPGAFTDFALCVPHKKG